MKRESAQRAAKSTQSTGPRNVMRSHMWRSGGADGTHHKHRRAFKIRKAHTRRADIVTGGLKSRQSGLPDQVALEDCSTKGPKRTGADTHMDYSSRKGSEAHEAGLANRLHRESVLQKVQDRRAISRIRTTV